MKKKMKMSAKSGKKKLPPALQKAMEAKKKKAAGKEEMSYGKGKKKMSYGAKKKKGMKMSITAKKAKVVKHKKKGRV